MTVTNWIKKNLCLNRISKEIRIKIKIKSIYDEATHLLNTHFIKKEINKQKAATDRFKLQFIYNRFFAVQQTYKMYSVICTHNSFIFTQQSHSDRTVCSAFRTVCVVFFDLIFFLFLLLLNWSQRNHNSQHQHRLDKTAKIWQQQQNRHSSSSKRRNLEAD